MNQKPREITSDELRSIEALTPLKRVANRRAARLSRRNMLDFVACRQPISGRNSRIRCRG